MQQQLGQLLQMVGSEKLCYASDAALSGGPAPYLRAFMDLEIPDDLRDGYGYPQITRRDRENILGLTFARLMGIDVDGEEGGAGRGMTPAMLARLDELSAVLGAHAGGVELVEVDGGIVRLRYTGMCTGCPLRPLTTASTVRPALLALDGVESVEGRIEGSRISRSEEPRARLRGERTSTARAAHSISRRARSSVAASTRVAATASSTMVNSAGVWLRPSLLRAKTIATLRDPRHVLRVVTCAAVHADERDALFAAARSSASTTPGAQRQGGRSSGVLQEISRPRRSAISRISCSWRACCFSRVRGSGWRESSVNVTLSGTADGRFGSTWTRPNGGHRRRTQLEGDSDYGSHDLGEARHRIEPAHHRPRAGMIGPAGELYDVVTDARDRVDDAHRKPGRLEDGALLDVELDPGLDVVPRGLGNASWIEPDGAHRLTDRDSVGVEDPLGSSGSIVPAIARDPQKLAAWKRLASSSQRDTASIVRRGRPKRSRSVRSATSAPTTPSAPS